MAGQQVADSSTTTINQLSDDVGIGGKKDWGNKLVVNTGRNPVVNFNFMLRVEGVFDLPCKAVKGIRRENEFDYIQEGGLNDYVHLKRKAISKPFTFQVERYVGVNWVDPMPLGTELVLPLILFVNTHVFPGLQPVRNYVFTGCTVIGKDYGELNAEVSGLLLETVTIAYREMICLDIPSDTYKSDDVWHFNGKEKQGGGDRHYNANLYNREWESAYSSKAAMEERAKAAGWVPEKDTDGSLKTKHAKDYEAYATDFNEAIDKEIQNAKTPEEKEAAREKKIAMAGAVKRKYNHSKTATRDGSAKYNTDEQTREQLEKNAVRYKHTGEATREGSAKYDKDEQTREQLEKNAVRYKHTGEITREGSAKYDKDEQTREQLEKNAARWKPEKDADGGLKTKYGRDYETYATNYNKAIDREIENAKTPEEKEAAREKKIAMAGAVKRKYNHSKTATRDGSAKYNSDEQTKEQLEKNAVRYKHTGEATREGSAKYDKDEQTREQLEKNAVRYSHTKTATRKGPATYQDSELTRTAMEAKVRQWPPTRSAKQITEYLKKH